MGITSGKSLILCKSIRHQNTAKIARAMSEVLDADVVCPEEWPCTGLADYELVGFGSGVYYSRLHATLWDARLQKLDAFKGSFTLLPLPSRSAKENQWAFPGTRNEPGNFLRALGKHPVTLAILRRDSVLTPSAFHEKALPLWCVVPVRGSF